MPAILFGSISTLADTSELQRQSFNEAFAQHGLNWRWDRDQYREMLSSNGGADRVREYATSVGETVDAVAVHQTKSALFQQKLATAPVSARPGVNATIEQAKAAGIKLALVTTTSPDNISALFTALTDEISRADFDLIVSADDVEQSKPDPAAYLFAKEALGDAGGNAVAIEDNVGGGRAAEESGLRWIAFPNENTGDQSFDTALARVDHLEPDRVTTLVSSSPGDQTR